MKKSRFSEVQQVNALTTHPLPPGGIAPCPDSAARKRKYRADGNRPGTAGAEKRVGWRGIMMALNNNARRL